MTITSHIRRLVLIAVIGCAVLLGGAYPAGARMIDDPTLQTQTAVAPATAHAHAVRSDRGNEQTLPIALAASLVLASLVTGTYVRRTRTSRRAAV